MVFIGWVVWIVTAVWFGIDCYQERFRAKSESYTPDKCELVFLAERLFLLFFFLIFPARIWNIIWLLVVAKVAAFPLSRGEIPLLSDFFLGLSDIISKALLSGTEHEKREE